jgi:hypothetical protein
MNRLIFLAAPVAVMSALGAAVAVPYSHPPQQVAEAINVVVPQDPIQSIHLDKYGNLHIYHYQVLAVVDTPKLLSVAKLGHPAAVKRCQASLEGWAPGGTTICFTGPGLAREIYGTGAEAEGVP